MTLTLRSPLTYAVGLALVMLIAGPAASQTAQSKPQTDSKAGRGGNMMADRQQMMADMKAHQKKLDDLVAAMNQATGSEKVDRLAAVVTELVSQHREMSARMSGGMMMQMPATQPAPSGTEHDHAGHNLNP